MIQIVSLVLPLFGLIALGYIAGRLRRLPIEGLAWLNFFVLYIALPALFFRLLAETPMHEFANIRFLVTTTLSSLLIFALCFLIAYRLRRADIRAAAIQGFVGAYGNIGYLGPPLAIAAFGAEAAAPVALIFCLDNAMHFTLAPTLMAISEKNRQPAGKVIGGIAKSIFTHPFILATIAGIVAASLQYTPPSAIASLLDNVSTAAAPCALFAMGITAALRPVKRIPLELVYLIPIKLVLFPLALYFGLSAIPDLNPTWLHAAVLMAALPTATNVFIMAQQYHIWEERASSAIVISTLLSIITVTVYLYLVTNNLI
ncbi:MAG: AEC family transporter [Granulosicoccus sp.]|nr:AEC family transporter [Granulosicoccus sp.]